MQKLIKNCQNKYFLLILLIFTLNSCVSRVDKRGYMIELADYHLLEEGVTTKDKAIQIMGSPTIMSDLDGEVWIYFAEDVKSLLFFKPSVIDRKIITLQFSDGETLQKLQTLTLSDESKINFSYKHTEVKSNEIGIFKSLFSNIGQVKPQ